MNQIRYTQRICNDSEKIEKFLSQTRTGIIGMINSDFPYAVPVNYIWYHGYIYFHGMGSGKKHEILSKEPNVCFTVFKETGTVMDAVPCHADTAYMSVMIFGKVEKLTDFGEAADALTVLAEKYMPGFYPNRLSSNLMEKYRSSMDGNAVSVYRIKPQEMTAKENVAASEQLFSHDVVENSK